MNKTILIVDDVPDNIHLLKSILSDDGYRVRTATNGHKALQLAAMEPLPDLILLDIMMPEIDGYEVCQRLKSEPRTKNIPVIFVTAMSESEDETRGFALGAVDYLTKPVSPPVVRARVQNHLTLVRTEFLDELARDSIRMLGEAGHYNDTDTGEHIWRMAAYSRALAVAAGLTAEEAELIELAAPMHDTGKIGIPDSILKAPRKLEPEEWETMKQHSEIGHGILSKSNSPVFKLAAEIALCHHEKWDGSGYPQGICGEAIPLSARIVALADVFDAVTMRRPYKEPWSIEQSLELIRSSNGSHFDPRLVDAFLSIEGEIRAIKSKWDKIEDSGSDDG